MNVDKKLSKMAMCSILKLCKIYNVTPTPPTKKKAQLIKFVLSTLASIPDFQENLDKLYYNESYPPITTRLFYRNGGVYKFRYKLIKPCAHLNSQFSHIKYFYIFPTLDKIKFTSARGSSVSTSKLSIDIMSIPEFLSVVDLSIFKSLYKNINQPLRECTSQEITTHLPQVLTKIVSKYLFLY